MRSRTQYRRVPVGGIALLARDLPVRVGGGLLRPLFSFPPLSLSLSLLLLAGTILACRADTGGACRGSPPGHVLCIGSTEAKRRRKCQAADTIPALGVSARRHVHGATSAYAAETPSRPVWRDTQDRCRSRAAPENVKALTPRRTTTGGVSAS